ncbi:uncharacterized protein LOC121377727 [Gigantopelta aegis]|uniref:uncharacterized protein LOC121377727 n=1 Tax=Gigantopelta aegis TaxID=1735272 RepID=UPI001B88CFC0|nr:uncharacterized protein LOC121377727 [Gigantopelta aegis]
MPKKEKNIKLPVNAGPVKPNPPASIKNEATYKKEVEKFVDSLLESDWHPYCGRPRSDLHGYFVIFRWVNKDKLWVPLFADVGQVTNRINQIFSGKHAEPISRYLSSFPKEHRKLIWIKWQQLALEEELPELDEVLKVVAMKYNNGERPAFNFDKDDLQGLPSNFSILG